MPYIASFICHTLAGERTRYQNGSRIVGASRRKHDHDLYACIKSRWQRGTQPSRWPVNWSYRYVKYIGAILTSDIRYTSEKPFIDEILILRVNFASVIFM